jgi:hypothetical protein
MSRRIRHRCCGLVLLARCSSSDATTGRTVPAATPSVVTLTPANVMMESGAQSLVVTGTGFTSSSVVLVHASPRTPSVSAPGVLIAELLASDIVSPGMVPVTVSTGRGRGLPRRWRRRPWSQAGTTSSRSAWDPGRHAASRLIGAPGARAPIATTFRAVSVAVANPILEVTCALGAAGDASCFGNNGYTVFGDSGRGASYVTTPSPVSFGAAFLAIATADTHNCGISASAVLLG